VCKCALPVIHGLRATLGFCVTVVADACASDGMQDYRDAKKTISAEETHHASMGMLANDEARVVMTGELLRLFGKD
jgi:isochorismate hydrolase